jgi:hypothetical protein
LVAVAVVLVVETLLVAESYQIAHRDTQPPSRWSQAAQAIFFGGKQ